MVYAGIALVLLVLFVAGLALLNWATAVQVDEHRRPEFYDWDREGWL